MAIPIGLHKILSERYPKTAGPYVVSQSILDNKIIGSNFGQAMMNYIGNIPTPSKDNNYQIGVGEMSIKTAMDFLSSVITNERNKENQFISFISQKSGLTPPSTSENWAQFVAFFQQQLDLGQLGIIRLENELNRLKSNSKIQGINITTKSEKEITLYIRNRLDVLEYTKKALEGVAKYLSGGRNQMGKTIVEYIYKKYGEKLVNITVNNSGLDVELNQTNVNGLILMISQLLAETFYNKKLQTITDPNTLKKASFLKNNFENTIDNFLQEDSLATHQINEIFQKAQELPFFTKDLAHLYKLDVIPENKNNKKQSKIDPSMQDQTDAAIKQVAQKTQSKKNSPTITLIKNTSALAEISSLLRNLVNGAMGLNTGGVNAKPDNIIAYLQIEVNGQEDNEELQRDLITAQEKINNEIKMLAESLKNKNTTEYYNNQKKEWDKHIAEIEKILKELQNTYKILANCFIIEDSTKHYVNMGIGEEKDFMGGSLGANIKDQIGKIQALQDGNLISAKDAKWLITAAINCGPGLIGQNLKPSLEHYLSAFAVILLFDDQQNIAAEVSQQMINNLQTSQTSVQKIHLFSLDGGYYPLSVVLQLTYDKLAEIYGLLDSEKNSENSYGAQVSIEGFINPDSFFPPHKYNNMRRSDWDKLSAEAQASVKMHVKFISNFMGLLNTILNK